MNDLYFAHDTLFSFGDSVFQLIPKSFHAWLIFRASEAALFLCFYVCNMDIEKVRTPFVTLNLARVTLFSDGVIVLLCWFIMPNSFKHEHPWKCTVCIQHENCVRLNTICDIEVGVIYLDSNNGINATSSHAD